MIEKELKQAKKANEELLKWASVQEILTQEAKRMSEEDLQARAASAEIFWRVYFEKELKALTAQQLDYMGKNIENDRQILWIRGVLAGLDIVKVWFEAQLNVSMARFNQENQ
jgi:hypothetical protein